jgi:hypothetical protein
MMQRPIVIIVRIETQSDREPFYFESTERKRSSMEGLVARENGTTLTMVQRLKMPDSRNDSVFCIFRGYFVKDVKQAVPLIP